MQYENTVRQKIGQAMTIAIKDRGFTKEHVAEQAGISKMSLYAVLNGQSNYNIDTLIKIMRIVQVHIDISLLDADNNIFGKLPNN